MNGRRVLEIGGGVGQLASAARSIGIEAPWTILEPNPVSTKNAPADVSYLIGFVGPGFVDMSESDVMVMSHVMEHFYFPADVIAALADALPPEGELFLAWPALETWCERLVPGALNFEHNYFVDTRRLVCLFEAQGLKLVAEDRFDPLATFFLAFRKLAHHSTAFVSRGEGGRTVQTYYHRLRDLSTAVNAIAADASGPCFMTPASVYSQTLLSLGLDSEVLTALLDNSRVKQGLALFGFNLPILDPMVVLPEVEDALIILNAGAHNDEIKQQYLRLNSALRFVDVRDFSSTIERL